MLLRPNTGARSVSGFLEYLTTLFQPIRYVAPNYRMHADDGLDRMLKEYAVACFNILFRNFFEGTEEIEPEITIRIWCLMNTSPKPLHQPSPHFLGY